MHLRFDILKSGMEFRAADYGAEVARILVHGREGLAGQSARGLFPNSVSPEGALAGLYVHFGRFDDAHGIVQDLNTKEGSYWHGIVHREEPDGFNAAYWFRQLGSHAIFPALNDEARRLGYEAGACWDPFAFIDYCEAARVRPGSREQDLADQVRRAEWQLLFDYCAREKAIR